MQSWNHDVTRRRFLQLGALAVVGLPAACGSDVSAVEGSRVNGRLNERPGTAHQPLATGRHALGLGTDRDGFLQIPPGYQHGRATPLLVLLHGAGRSASEWISALSLTDAHGVVVLAPDSRGVSWDRVRGDFGPDVAFIDFALKNTFQHCSVDTTRIGLAGFSDGGTYALSLGLTNGDLFTHILGFSPGFLTSDQRRGKPPLYITHGTRDTVLPIDLTSRRIVPSLRADGYNVTYQEFDGQHELSGQIGETFRWFVGASS